MAVAVVVDVGDPASTAHVTHAACGEYGACNYFQQDSSWWDPKLLASISPSKWFLLDAS